MIDGMKKENEIQAIPEKRTEKTFRLVLQHFEPDAGTAGRYRDVDSIRLESARGPEHMDRIFRIAMKVFTRTGTLQTPKNSK